jgi:co-chaperonin GroES (HSP10)
MKDKRFVPFKPVNKGILVEVPNKNKTASGLIVGDMAPQDLPDFVGFVVLSVGDDVTATETGETVMFKPNAHPIPIKLDFLDKKRAFFLFQEYDIMFVRLDIPILDNYTLNEFTND